jgi:hypothetical protein
MGRDLDPGKTYLSYIEIQLSDVTDAGSTATWDGWFMIQGSSCATYDLM